MSAATIVSPRSPKDSVDKAESFSCKAAAPKDIIPAGRVPRRQKSSSFHYHKVDLEVYPHFNGTHYLFTAMFISPHAKKRDTHIHTCRISIEVPPSQRQQLLARKLEQCQIMFDFNDPDVDLRNKEIKRQALQEILAFVSTTQAAIDKSLYPAMINMVTNAILPPPCLITL